MTKKESDFLIREIRNGKKCLPWEFEFIARVELDGCVTKEDDQTLFDIYARKTDVKNNYGLCRKQRF